MFFRKYQDPKPLPRWLKIAILLFVCYSVVISLTSAPLPGEPAKNGLQPIDWSKQFNWDDYKEKVFPGMNTPIRTTEVQQGTGEAVICGQEIGIRYSAFLPDGKEVDGNLQAEQPLVYRLGGGRVVPALEKGMTGMRVGGKRTITASANMAFGGPGWAEHYPEIAPFMVRFEVELVSAAPAFAPPGPATLGLRQFDYAVNGARALGCGDAGNIYLTVWDSKGGKLYSNMEEGRAPLPLRIGAAQAPLGLEQGLMGLSPGNRRTLIVPPAYVKPLLPSPSQGESVPPISLPENETLVMDVALVPTETKEQ